MAFPTLTGRAVALSIFAATAAAGTYTAAATYRSLRVADPTHITAADSISDSFRNSATVQQVVNPRNHMAIADSRYMTVELPLRHCDVSDEVLLAQFVKGFFGGWVFAPEAAVLKRVRPEASGFSNYSLTKTSQQIWNASELSEHTLPPLRSVLWGSFYVVDAQNAVSAAETRDKNDHKQMHKTTERSIDFAFGSEQSRFAGAHRFSIIRNEPGSEEGRTRVCVRFDSMACNPTVNKGIGPTIIWKFHKAYAMLLYREAVSEMMRYLEDGS